MKQPEDAATVADVLDIITPLFLALHHEKVISLQAIAMQYEDVLAKRQLIKLEPAGSLDVLQLVLGGLHKLEQRVPPK